MTPLAVVATLSEMGVVPISPGPGQLRLVAKEGNVPRGAVELARAHREVLVEFVTAGIKCSSCGSGDAPVVTAEPTTPEPIDALVAPADAPFVGTCCPTCRGIDLVDDPAGIACTACCSLAFIEAEDGSLVRVDHLTPTDEVDANTVPDCPDCGGWCDVETLGGSWRCSRCDPDAEARRRRTKRILRLRDRIVERAK